MGRVLAVIIWLLTLGSVSLFFVKKWWFPTGISEHAPALDRQFMLTIIVVGLAFTAAQVGLGYMVWKYRDTGNRDRATYTHGSSKLEVIWTTVTAVIFIGLAVMGQSVWASLRFTCSCTAVSRRTIRTMTKTRGRSGAYESHRPSLHRCSDSRSASS